MWQFSLFGIPITVEPMHWVSLGIIGYLSVGNGELGSLGILVFVLAGFLSILIHELGHAAAIRKFRLPVEIRMITLGGVAIHPPARTRTERFIISAAGPVAQAAAGFLILFLMKNLSIPAEKVYFLSFFDTFIWISFLWAIFNCLPIFPMDGGHMVKELCGPTRRTWTHIIALITVGLIIVAMVVTGYVATFALIMLLFMGYQNYQMLQLAKRDQDRWKS